MSISDDHRREVARAIGLPEHLAPEIRGGNLEQLMLSGQRLADDHGYVGRAGG